MSNIEKDLSEYIDRLNEEKKPAEHEGESASPELEELMDTVRLVKSLKEPGIPSAGYSKQLAKAVAGNISRQRSSSRPKRTWFVGIASVAAAIVLIFTLNLFGGFGGNNIVYAMEQAFQEVEAYHGILEVRETNADGADMIQSQLEVWADKEGRYHIKELQGTHLGMITVNNGEQKWQVRPDLREVQRFAAFPDPYRFVFELGKEIENVKNAIETEVIGEEQLSERRAIVVEVSPKGGAHYKLWIDKKTKLPLQKQSAMQNALQYTITYTTIDFKDTVPSEFFAYNVPEGYVEIKTNAEQVVNSLEEAAQVAGFTPVMLENNPQGYIRSSIAVDMSSKAIKLYYTNADKQSKILVLQGKVTQEFEAVSTAIIGSINNKPVEIQSPMEGSLGILAGGGPYAGVINISSIRWQEGEFEYAVLGDDQLEQLELFVKAIAKSEVLLPSKEDIGTMKPQVDVAIDLEIEQNEQKSADAGHLAWKLDPAFVAQVFVSLKLSPEGIQGEYPIKYEDIKIIQNTGEAAVVEIGGSVTSIKRVYLKKLIRQDMTGIWTVVGYDSVDKQ